MSAQWSPPPAAPASPRRRGRRAGGSAFRDSVIIGGVAVVGAVGLVVWGGGDAPAAGPGPGGQGTGELVAEGQPATAAPVTVAGNAPAVAAGNAAVTTVAAGAAGAATAAAPVAAGGTGDYEVDVGMQDSLIGMLPVPAGMTEQPAEGSGVRTWTAPGTEWQPLRDAYLQALSGQGYTYVLGEAIDRDGAVGELYQLTHASGVTLELAAGAIDGQSVLEVTRR